MILFTEQHYDMISMSFLCFSFHNIYTKCAEVYNDLFFLRYTDDALVIFLEMIIKSRTMSLEPMKSLETIPNYL